MFSNYRRRSQGFWSLTDTASHLSKRFSLSCKVYWFCPSCAGYITVGWGCAHPLGCRRGCQEGSQDAGGGDGGHPVLRPPTLPPQHPEGILLAPLETPGPSYTAHTPSPAVLPLAQHTPAGGGFAQG